VIVEKVMEERGRFRLEELERENEQLKAELISWRSGLSQLGWFSRIVLRISTAFGLGARLRQWMEAVRTKRTIPTDETVDLAAAVLNRWLIGSLLGIFIALVPSVILGWQIVLFTEQNQQFQEQNVLLRQQNAHQLDETLRAQRIEYLQSLYDRSCENQQKTGDPNCPSKFNARIRADALVAFVALERRRADGLECLLSNGQTSVTVNAIEARLDEASLAQVDLRCVRLSRAYLFEADLSGADLSKADLSEASLYRADLSNANLTGANLTGVMLESVKLDGAKFCGTIMPQGIKNDRDCSPGFESSSSTIRR
jgi:hypothetical protein